MTTVKPVKSVNHQTTKSPEKPEPKQLVTLAPKPVPASEDRHLAEWGSGGLRLLSFNGSTGIHRTIDDGAEVPDGTQFIALLHATRKGFIRFNGPGVPPDIRMVGIDEAVATPTRESLGDTDPSKWPVGRSGTKEDPWKEQIVFPVARYDAGAALFLYVARGIVAVNSARSLLSEWRYHPKRQAGLIPVIAIKNSTYFSKKLNSRRPKPAYEIVLWVTKAGEVPSSSEVTKAIEQALAFNDEIDI
jgi:hypothetical protein